MIHISFGAPLTPGARKLFSRGFNTMRDLFGAYIQRETAV